MKKRYLFIVLLVSLLFINVNVYAEGDVKYITVLDAEDSEYTVVREGQLNHNIEGVEYLEESNTLVLEDCNYSHLYIEEMGENFKIELKGVNKFSYIVILGTDVTIGGEGTLIVDSTVDSINPTPASVFMEGRNSFFRVSNEATVKLYSNDTVISYSDVKDSTTVRLIFDNGLDISDQLEFKSAMGGPGAGSEMGYYSLPLKEFVIEPKVEEPAQEVENPYTGTGMILIIDAIILLGVLGFAVKTLKKA